MFIYICVYIYIYMFLLFLFVFIYLSIFVCLCMYMFLCIYSIHMFIFSSVTSAEDPNERHCSSHSVGTWELFNADVFSFGKGAERVISAEIS